MRNKIFTALLIVLVIVLTYLLVTSRGNKESGIEPAAKELVNAEVKNIVTKMDREGFEHTVMSDKENVIKSVAQLDTNSRKKLDSVNALLGIKEKQLEHWISYSAKLEGKLLKAVRTDTSFRYEDKWANIEYVISKDTANNGHFNFKYNADINYAEYWKRNHFLAPKKHYIDFWINDPRATINGVKRIKIEAKEPKFKVEGSSIVMYDGHAHIGADVGVKIGKVKVGTSYMYNTATGDLKPYYYGKFKLLDF
ncbi:hypothetical protein OHD16_06765 [Sphingobacterium sp. ML3W]|uniref:hypothetical protein n=1 Tax=Sphingobacterium sp. ML3W TaxID=1538644 RepID=UPI002499FE7D|nr:hypothetical protein [Sphingobacterium sp. ML3W]WFA79671.1 hypothetical protein OGI71_27005 [Sphingobacterium sp. ML3W]